MKSTGLWLLLALFAIQACADVYQGSAADLHYRAKRAAVELHDWLTAEQKEVLEGLRDNPEQFHDKTVEFYKQLPQEKRDEWDKFYKKECVAWIKEVATEEERNELKQLKEKKDKETIMKKIHTYRERLSEDKRKMIEKFEPECLKLWKDEVSRKRRDLDKNFDEFTKWMTEEQRKTISEMKDAGKSDDDLRTKAKEYFEALPADKQTELKEEFKGKCKAFFKKISKPEEMEKMKTLHEAGNDDEVRTIVKGIIGRLTGDEKTLAGKMEVLCHDIFTAKAKRRRDIDEKINKRLSWMTADQKEQIKNMHASGKSHADIRAKIFEFLSELEGPAGIAAREQTQKECYKWMNDVATEEEIAALHEMHERDHDGCKKRVREFIARLPDERRAEVEKNLPFCEKVWYGDHDHHGGHDHHHGHHRRQIAVRRRRHLKAIDKYLDWLTPEQKNTLVDIEKSGAEFDSVIAKVKEFYGKLGEEKKAELKANFKSQCSAWVKEVATPEEMEKIKEMHKNKDHAELKKKLAELENRLTEEQKHTVEHVREVCLGVWEIQNSRRRRGQEYFTLEKILDNYLTWLTDAQKEELKSLKAAGNKDKIYDKVLSYLDNASGEQRKKAIEDLQSGCKHYIRNIVGDEKADEFKQMKESGVSPDEIAKKIEVLVDGLTNEEVKAQAKKAAPVCKAVYSAAKRFRREHHEHKLDEEMKKYLTWLSADQMHKLEEKFEKEGREPGYNLVMEMFEASSGETKAKATEELKSACKHFGRKLLGDKNADIIKEMKDSGATNEAITKRVEEMIAEISDPVKKERAEKMTAGCKKIYAHSRRRRGQELYTLEKVLENYLTWLNEDQKAELKKLKEAGNKDEIYKKIVAFLDAASGDQKKKAIEDVQTGCKHYIRNIVGDEKADEFKQMRESGVSPDEISKKIDALVEELTNEEVKTQAKKAKVICLAAFTAPKRFRRGQELYTLEKVLDNYLTWLTDAQKEELKSLKAAGNKDQIYDKVLSYIDAASGEQKKKAIEDVQNGCRHYIRNIVGDEKADEFKQMRESGVSDDEIAKKIEALVEGLDNAEVKAQAKKAAPVCKAAFSAPKRLRRGQELYTLEKVLDNYLTWLNEDQKAELKKLKEAGNKDEIYKKIVSFLDAASGDQKKKAIEDVQTGCKHYIRNIVGDEKADEFKQMRESGVSPDEIGKKIEALVEGLTNEEVKAQAKKAKIICLAAFSAPKRRRRGQELYTLEKVLDNYLTWLNEDQKAELKKLKEAGNKDEIYKKIVSFLDAASGDQKKKAIEDVQTGCKHYIRNIVGDEKADEFKQMRESGVSPDEIGKKIEALVEGLTNEEVKAQAKKAKIICLAAFTAPKRFRREHHQHTFAEAMENYLSWLSDDQKIEMKQLHEAGDKGALYEKVMEMFDAATGETKEEAASKLKDACRHYVKDLIGNVNADRIHALKESGATNDEIATRVEEIIEEISDDEKKEHALKASKYCKRIYNVARRMRRDEHEHDVEEALEKFLTWLSADQKDEVKKLYESGKRDEIYGKVMEYYNQADKDVKEKATSELKDACRHYIGEAIGKENKEKVEKMKDSGATKEEISAKVEEFISAIADEKKRAHAERAHKGCKKIYGVIQRKRRDEHEHHHDLEEALKKYLTWMSEDQKAEVKKTLKGGDRLAAYKKMMEYFEGTTGETKQKAATELKAACKHYIKELIGEEKSAKIKHMKESGATNEAIAQELDAIISLIPNEKKRVQAQHAAADCKKIFNVAKKLRREVHEPTLEEGFQKYLTWLSDGQKDELRKLEANKDREGIFKKIMEYFEGATGEVKSKATEELKEGCKHHITTLIGKEKADELKKLKDTGVTDAEMAKKVDEVIETITDEEIKAKAKKAAAGCHKIFGVTKARRHLAARRFRKSYKSYLSSGLFF
ncbi:unnamed protein product [Cylicocyclus nassatus]|uniref:Polyprotein allergen nematode domain-containing protein n=1 Tax=Cylicocyclus nassatus TaxID=53992 RepID=A0AA36DK10_CYLNA|nr:unnamed protein product [Cylicocyclus nassatus]